MEESLVVKQGETEITVHADDFDVWVAQPMHSRKRLFRCDGYHGTVPREGAYTWRHGKPEKCDRMERVCRPIRDGWTKDLLNKGLSINFIDLEFALRQDPDFKFSDSHRSSSKKEPRNVFSTVNRAKPLLEVPNLVYLEVVSSPDNTTGIAWLPFDPSSIQTLLEEEYSLRTNVISRQEAVDKANAIQKKNIACKKKLKFGSKRRVMSGTANARKKRRLPPSKKRAAGNKKA